MFKVRCFIHQSPGNLRTICSRLSHHLAIFNPYLKRWMLTAVSLIFSSLSGVTRLRVFIMTSGYICIALPGERLEELEIPMMVPDNQDRNKTAYTVTVDYRHGACRTSCH